MLVPHGLHPGCTKDSHLHLTHNQTLVIMLHQVEDLILEHLILEHLILEQAQMLKVDLDQDQAQTPKVDQDQVHLEQAQMFTPQLWLDSHLASTLLTSVWTGTHVQLIASMTANVHKDFICTPQDETSAAPSQT